MARKKKQKARYPGTGERLLRAREALGKGGHGNQGKYASVLTMTKHAYGQWENGVNLIPLDQAILLCRAYGLSLDYIYLGDRSGLPERLFAKLAPTSTLE